MYNVKILKAFCYYQKYNNALFNCYPSADIENFFHIKIINQNAWL